MESLEEGQRQGCFTLSRGGKGSCHSNQDAAAQSFSNQGSDTMLVLARRVNQRILITCPSGELITIVLTGVARRGREARLGFDAPDGYQVDREEVAIKKKAERLEGQS